MTKEQLQEWLKLTDETRLNIFTEIAGRMGLPASAIEKDWWVTRTLQLVFQTEIAKHTVFKGGTSLSKAWNLIDRFSEDIDLALDRKFLGFDKADTEMSGSQVAKLRRHSLKYISEKYFPMLQKTFHDAGYTDVKLQLSEIKSPDEDPVKIEVAYPVLTEKVAYINPPVVIEIGSRSEKEPFSETQFSSLVGEHFKERDFADSNIKIPTVNPERTFLEKVFLLHEAFQQPQKKVKVDRQSRHLYDLEKLMETEFAEKAIADHQLYEHIVEHRRIFNPIGGGVSYDNHVPEKINPLPPKALENAWKKDYEDMQKSMIYKESISYAKLIERITELKNRINKIKK